jgi:kinesin family member C2/C3
MQVRDLLAETRGARLDIQNTKESGANVPDALQVAVTCTQDVLDVMFRGQANRATADTKMNERSSRSHSVLTVIVAGQNTVTNACSLGCLHLIDLAGSERIGRSEASGDRLEEAKYINKSLSAIGDVMSALASKSKHVPFRYDQPPCRHRCATCWGQRTCHQLVEAENRLASSSLNEKADQDPT